jgi:hypothetical protein
VGNSAERTESAEEADRDAILALLNRWRIATSTKDINAILELVTDDVVFLPSSVPPRFPLSWPHRVRHRSRSSNFWDSLSSRNSGLAKSIS